RSAGKPILERLNGAARKPASLAVAFRFQPVAAHRGADRSGLDAEQPCDLPHGEQLLIGRERGVGLGLPAKSSEPVHRSGGGKVRREAETAALKKGLQS